MALLRRSDVSFWEVGDDAVVYDPVSGNGHVMNRMALGIWHRCDGEHSAAEIEKELLQLYPDEATAIRADVSTALTELVKLGLASDVSEIASAANT